MLDFRSYKIGELGRVITGKTPPTKKPELLGDGAAFITPTDLDETSIFAKPERRLSKVGEEAFARSLLPTQAVCFTCIASVGKMCMTQEPSLTNQQINSIIVDEARFDPRWVFYALKTKREYIRSIASGSATPIINKTSFSNVELDCPPLETQQRITAILGAYDDLIEVNRRRVAVLEKMARGLFEEWFVRFRFPGHEDVPIVDTPDGPLPEGWEYAPLKNVLSLRSGFAFKSSTFVDDAPYSIVTIKHVHDGLLKPPFASKVIEPPKKMPEHCKIREGDILVSLTGNVGRTCLAWGEDLLLNQRVAKVDPSEKHYGAFAYCWFRSTNTLKRLQNIANGAAQQNLSPVQTVGLVIPIPPAPVANMFETVLHPMLQSIVLAHRSNAVLEVQRDLLLPRLISGQLSVKAAESQLEDAA